MKNTLRISEFDFQKQNVKTLFISPVTRLLRPNMIRFAGVLR
jgi:hypothetical protein